MTLIANRSNVEKIAMYGGTSYGADESYKFDDLTIRNGFIRKVYSILMLQLLVSFAFVAMSSYHDGTRQFIHQSPGLLMVSMVVMIVTLIALSCCENLRRKSPHNIILLSLFTLSESFLLGVTAATTKPEIVVTAVGITAAICFVLTIFAFQTKIDFTGCGVYLMVGAVVIMIFGFVLIFFKGSSTTHIIYGGLGALLFSFYLIYDTQLMIGGKHSYSISPEEYIFAALNLYLDIIQIFLFILQILRSSDD